MKITLNNKTKEIESNSTVEALLSSIGANLSISLVSINDNVISQDQFETHIICENDVVDVMKFASGG